MYRPRFVTLLIALAPVLVIVGLIAALVTCAGPADAAPRQHVTIIEPADRSPRVVRVTYVERINSRANYVEFNSGATVYIRTCSQPRMWNCVDPTTGTVGLREHGVQMTVLPSRNVRLG